MKENFDMFAEKDTYPPEYRSMKGRYIELGSLVPKPMDGEGAASELNPLESSSLAYLKRVAEVDPETRFAVEPLGLLSPYVTEAKQASIRKRIQALHQDLLAGKSPEIVAAKQDEDIAMSLFLFPRKSNPFEFIGGAVALLKEGDGWKASATPAVFANTNLPYEGDKRMRAGALENWATKELAQQLSTAAGKRVKEAKEEVVKIRVGLQGNSAEDLLFKLAQGMVKRDPVTMAAMMNLEGGAEKVMEFLNQHDNMGEQTSGYLDRLCGRRSVIVPLDPKPLDLNKEQQDELQKELQEERENRGDEAALEKNGEAGKECALGVILVKPAMRYNSRQQVTFYVELKYCLTWKNAPEEPALNKKEHDTAPLLHFGKVDSSIQDWELGRFAHATTTNRMARDFHRSYPAFQFKTPQEAAACILPALQGEHFTELLRCLPPQNFTTGIVLLDYIGSLIKLSEQAGSTFVNNDRNSKADWRLLDIGSEVPPKTFENVVIYERPTEAIVCWTVSSGAQGREQMSSLLLQKHGDYWYLLLPSDPNPSENPSLVAVASNLLAAYRVNCQKGVYLKAGVLESFQAEKLPQKEAIEAAQKWSTRVNDAAEKKDLMELMKHCLALEDTPEARQRMGEAVQEHISNYGHEKVTSTIHSWDVKETCFFENILLGEAKFKEGKALAPRILDAPMTMYVYQKGGIKWVPELTLFAPTSPVRKMLSNKRLNMAKKILDPQVYEEYLAGYKAHCQKVVEWQKGFEKREPAVPDQAKLAPIR